MRSVSFQEYVKEVLKRATYKKGKDFPCVVAVAPDLPGCLTQGDDFEEARENLIDAIQLWITSALRDGESLPTVNGHMLVTARPKVGRQRKKVSHA
jgi:predicted RNase H-like HicB family nuclease